MLEEYAARKHLANVIEYFGNRLSCLPAARDRLRHIFDNCENILICFSTAGKRFVVCLKYFKAGLKCFLMLVNPFGRVFNNLNNNFPPAKKRFACLLWTFWENKLDCKHIISSCGFIIYLHWAQEALVLIALHNP